jgi:hypothetical protein
MARSKANDDLFNRLRAGGLRKRVASTVADAVGTTRRGKPPKQVDRVVSELKALAAEIEDRAKGGPARREAAAKKAAATRKRNAAKQNGSRAQASARRTASSARSTARSARSTSRSARTTAKQAARTTGRRAGAEATRLEALARQAERALLIPVGAALEARDRAIETAQTYGSRTKAKRRFDRFERRGAAALRRNRRALERDARELRREVEDRADLASSEAAKRVRSLAS